MSRHVAPTPPLRTPEGNGPREGTGRPTSREGVSGGACNTLRLPSNEAQGGSALCLAGPGGAAVER